MATPSLEASVTQAAAVGSEPSRCGFELSRNILHGVREARARRPDLVVKFGTYLIDNHAQRLGHEVWNVYEQVFVALLEHGKQRSEGRGMVKRAVPAAESKPSEPLATAQDYCNILALQFPKSLRVKRLEAMLWEAKGELDMAMADYEEILKEDPNHLAALKRQARLAYRRSLASRPHRYRTVSHLTPRTVRYGTALYLPPPAAPHPDPGGTALRPPPQPVACGGVTRWGPNTRALLAWHARTHASHHTQVALLRSRGRPGEAASKLVEHVEVVCSDTDAWLQLSEIYLSAMRFRR